MVFDEISQKALTILQSIYSLGKINKKFIPLIKELETDSSFEGNLLPDYYPMIYEKTINTIIELSVLLRRGKETLESYGYNINKLVKYSNVGKNEGTKDHLSFAKSLSKIIHSKQLYLQVIDINGDIGYAYNVDRNCEFTGKLSVLTEEKDKTLSTYEIDLTKFCLNAMMINVKIANY